MADFKKLRDLGFDLQDPMAKFNMTSPDQEAMPSDEESDPMAYAPAVEDIPAASAPGNLGFSQQDIDTIQSLPLPDAQKSIRAPSAAPQEPDQVDKVLEQAKRPSLENILAQLQKAREDQNRNLSLLQAGNKIAQAMAAGYGGKIDDGSDMVKSLRDQADMPIKDYAERIANEENDPNSDVSKFMRENAYAVLKKLNPEKKYDLENMTAGQLKKAFGNKLSSALMPQTAKPYQQGQMISKLSGDPFIFDPIKGKYINATTGEEAKSGELVRPIAYTDPVSGSRGYFGAEGMVVPGQKSGQSVQKEAMGESKEAPKMETVGDYRTSGLIQPKEWDNVVTKDKEGFEKQNGDKLKIISSLKGVESLVDEATKNPNAAASLGGIIGSLFEPGKLTDEDAKRYVQQLGIENKVKNWISTTAKGTIRPELAKEIKKTAMAYYTQVDKIVRANAEKYSKATKSALANGKQIDNKILADFYYQQDDQAPQSNTVKIKTPSGTIMNIPKEKLKDALAKGAKEVQ